MILQKQVHVVIVTALRACLLHVVIIIDREQYSHLLLLWQQS